MTPAFSAAWRSYLSHRSDDRAGHLACIAAREAGYPNQGQTLTASQLAAHLVSDVARTRRAYRRALRASKAAPNSAVAYWARLTATADYRAARHNTRHPLERLDTDGLARFKARLHRSEIDRSAYCASYL
jgi:hypothetical protein